VSAPGAGPNRIAALETLSRLARALVVDGFRSYDDVVRQYLQTLEVSSTNYDLRYALAVIQLWAGRQQEAITAFQQAGSGGGLEVLARFGAAQAHLLTGDPANAASAVRELEDALSIVRRSPPEPTVWAARPRMDGEELLAPDLEVAALLAKAYQVSGRGCAGALNARVRAAAFCK